MKVFNISPHRSGTQSFHAFCQDNGLKSAHWPGPDADAACAPFAADLDTFGVYEACRDHFNSADVFADLPCPIVYRELWSLYPGAKFVLTLRDPAAWIASVRRHFQGRGFGFLEKIFYWRLIDHGPETIDGYSDDDLRVGYQCYWLDAVSFLRARGASLLLEDLENPALGECIANFLGFDVTVPMGKIR